MSVFDQRPWLALYGAGIPDDIVVEHESIRIGVIAPLTPAGPVTCLRLEEL
jgi:hypothetical protein